MSRAKGHDGEAVSKLERAENDQFALQRVNQDLQLVQLRIKQAIKRGGLKELLEPALELIEETQARIDRVRGS